MVARDLELKLSAGCNKVVTRWLTWLLQVGDNYLDNMDVTTW